MRTTLTIDDDMLEHARAVAAHERKSVGEVVTAMMRQAVERRLEPRAYRNGILLLPDRPGPRPTLERINELRDDEE